MMKQLNDSLWGRGIILAFWATICCVTITAVVVLIPIILALVKHGAMVY